MHGNRKRDFLPHQDHRIVVKGRSVFFTFSDRFGPLLTDGFGNPTKYQPASERAAFWTPFEAWLAEHRKANPSPPVIP